MHIEEVEVVDAEQLLKELVTMIETLSSTNTNAELVKQLGQAFLKTIEETGITDNFVILGALGTTLYAALKASEVETSGEVPS